MFRTFLLFIICIIFSISSRGTHLVGGTLSLRHLDSTTYVIELKLYRDCTPGTAGPPPSVSISIRDKENDSFMGAINIVRDTLFVLTYPDVECLPKQLDCRQLCIYNDTITFDTAVYNNNAGYYLSYDNCCRNADIVNIMNPGSAGFLIYAEIPSPAKMINSLSDLTRPLLSFLCVGKPFSYDLKPIDADGDSLVFSLYTPLNSSSSGKPDNPLKWRTGYGLSYNIMDGSPDLKIGRNTGVLTVFPTRIGIYVFAVKCEEYRNGVKIGETRLENQFEVVACSEAPPLATIDNKSGEVSVSLRAEELTCFQIKGADPNSGDSVYLKAELPDSSDNLFAKGAVFSSQKLQGLDAVNGQLCWNPVCSLIREEPYLVNFIVHDNNCPDPFWDTLRVAVYVLPPLNEMPLFTTPDTNTVVYNVAATDLFQFNLDVIDSNASQLIRMEASSEVFGPSIALPFATFVSDTGIAESHGIFSWQTTCDHIRPQPYIVRFYAIDNACPDGDTTYWKMRIFVRKPANKGPLFSSPDTLQLDTTLIAGQLLNLPILISDSTDKFHNIRLEAISELFDTLLALPHPTFDSLSGDSTISTLFSWQTDCAHVRDEPYELTFYTFDNACPVPDTTFYTLRIQVNYPPNAAPLLASPFATNQTVVAGTVFQLDLAVQDSNLSDSVFILLDSEVMDPGFPASSPLFTTIPGLDTANATFYWEPGCNHIRDTPYTLIFYTFDNACRQDTSFYTLDLMVVPRANAAPDFTNTQPPSITVSEGDTINFPLPSADSQHPDSVFISALSDDLFGGTLAGNQPVFEGDSGISTANGLFYWETDCYHGRTEPYEIQFITWDNACPKPDTSFYTLLIYVTTNPKYSAKFLETPPLTDTLFADEKIGFELKTGTDNNNENVTIEASSEVFTSILPSYATFTQTGSVGTVSGAFDWQPGCQHVRSTPYTVRFKVYSDCPGSDTSYSETKILVQSHNSEINELPNAFTPNGDGKNDTYTLKDALKIYCDDSFYFQVFNRWGKKLFESADPRFEWTGENTPAGTYYYILESNLLKKNGTITLLR